jgi:hypothetical protein
LGRYRKVDPKIWNDAKFRALTERGKLVFLFLLTHPHMTMVGAMRATLPGLAAEIDIEAKAFGEAFGEAFRKAMPNQEQEQEQEISLPTLSQEPEITAPKPEPKTTERDTQPRTVVMTPGKTFELSEDLTDAVLEIGLAHPKNYRFIGLPAERFPWDQTTEILDAIERDGKDAVRAEREIDIPTLFELTDPEQGAEASA